MKSPEYENYYDNKIHIFEELKMEVTDKEVRHSDSNVNNVIVSENKELSKFSDQNEIKHETVENGLPLNVTIKTEHILGEVILDNNKNMSVPYNFTIQDVQLNSDERLLKDDVNLLKPNNEQTNIEPNMPRVAELNELHKCKLCDIYFDNLDNMLIHISLVHNEKSSKCELCGKQLLNVSNLKRHIILVHKHKEPPKVAEIIFKCINCNAELNDRLTLKDHAKLCRKEKEIIEYKCMNNSVYKDEQDLRDHVKRMHFDYLRTFECWCGEQCRSPQQLDKHRTQYHVNTNKEYICKFCGAFFKLKRYLTKHIRSIHYDYGRTFDCWCGKQFRTPAHLYQHKWQHENKSKDTDNSRFQCDSCQKVFKRRRNLVIHIKSVHYDYGRTFDCWCGKEYRSPVQLKLHKKSNQFLLYGGYKFYL